MSGGLVQPVIRGARFFLAHTPGLLRYGSKPARDINVDGALEEKISDAILSPMIDPELLKD